MFFEIVSLNLANRLAVLMTAWLMLPPHFLLAVFLRLWSEV
jgi:hypothetical protein